MDGIETRKTLSSTSGSRRNVQSTEQQENHVRTHHAHVSWLWKLIRGDPRVHISDMSLRTRMLTWIRYFTLDREAWVVLNQRQGVYMIQQWMLN